MTEERKQELLKELKENIAEEINFEGTSVGIYSVRNLKDWVDDVKDGIQGVEFVEVLEDSAIFKSEGLLFEIFLNVEVYGREVVNEYWDIRFYEEGM